MFVVDHILVADDVADAPFSCNLGACRGACCVQGTSGAPLEPDERADVEAVLPIVRHRLRPQAREVIDKKGVWETTSDGSYATTCVGEAECVFVRYDGSVAKCAIQEAHQRGETDFPKPVSCHLYPLRVQSLGDFESLRYEQIDICKPGIRQGNKQEQYLAEYLEWPLTRKFGADWFARFLAVCRERRDAIAEARQC